MEERSKRLRKGSLAWRVFGLTLVLFALPLLIASIFSLQRAEKGRYERLLRELQIVARGEALLASQEMNNLALVGKDLAKALEEAPHKRNQLLKEAEEEADVTRVLLIEKNEQGEWEGEPSDLQVASPEAFLASLQGQEPRLWVTDGEVMILAFPLKDHLRWLLFYQPGSQWLGAKRELLPSLTGQHLLLLSEDGTLIGHLDGGKSSLPLKRKKGTHYEFFDKEESEGEHLSAVGATRFHYEQEPYLWFEEPLPPFSYRVALLVPEKPLVGTIWRDALFLILLFIAILLVGGGITSWFVFKMARPQRQLMEVMHQVSQGDLTARFHPDPWGFELNELGERFNESVVALTETMARAHQARSEREKLVQELAIGRQIQESLLPESPPHLPGIEIAAHCSPAREVGGDFYDLYTGGPATQPNQLLALVADAAGKGISACLYALSLRSLIRSGAQVHPTLSQLVQETNRLFCEDVGASGMFVTAAFALYEQETHQLHLLTAGHPSPLLLQANGEVSSLGKGNLALGLDPTLPFQEEAHALGAGDLLFLYTDGLTEARNPLGELFGAERLLQTLKRAAGLGAQELLERILEELHHFAQGHPIEDDLTFLILKRSNSQ